MNASIDLAITVLALAGLWSIFAWALPDYQASRFRLRLTVLREELRKIAAENPTAAVRSAEASISYGIMSLSYAVPRLPLVALVMGVVREFKSRDNSDADAEHGTSMEGVQSPVVDQFRSVRNRAHVAVLEYYLCTSPALVWAWPLFVLAKLAIRLHLQNGSAAELIGERLEETLDPLDAWASKMGQVCP